MDIVRPFEQLPELKRNDYNDNFVPFVWLNNFLSKQEIDKIRQLWNDNNALQARINSEGDTATNLNIRRTKVIFIDDNINSWIYDKLAMACIFINANKYKFDIIGFQTKLQLATYSTNDFFGWHMDSGSKKNSNRKLSISIQLSDKDEYGGGELQFLSAEEPVNAPKEIGTAIIFPSYIQHRVQPITTGNRMSLVGWIAGPPYR